jgi:hypothetical protein
MIECNTLVNNILFGAFWAAAGAGVSSNARRIHKAFGAKKNPAPGLLFDSRQTIGIKGYAERVEGHGHPRH